MKRVFDLAEHQAEINPKRTMVAGKEAEKWVEYNCKTVVDDAAKFASALLSLNIKNDILEPEAQEKIALISNNRPEWIMTDLAVQQTGAVLTPLYPTISPNEFAFIMNQSEVRILILANQELYDRFEPAFKDIPTLKYIFSFDEIKGVESWKALEGTESSEQERQILRQRITENTLATIIYTSGTTGRPKGVMLTHKNIVSNVEDCMPVFSFAKRGARTLSFLPLNHIFEKTVTYIYINAGINIFYAESIDTIGENLKEVSPMVFTVVPRLLEKVYEKIMATGHQLTGIKKSLFFWAVNLGKQFDPQIKRGWGYRMKLKLANKLVFSKWREALGGEVKAVISGSAPLSDRLNRIFSSAKITVMEGYGLTETSPVVAVNRFEPKRRMIGTVGEAIRNVTIKIAPDGEILCKGPNIMLGYYKNEEETKMQIDEEGWFHTGDIGELLDGKFLKITDRKNEMFKTSGGKWVAPSPIENKFNESRFVSQIMVIGAQRKFVSALIVPDFKNVYERLKANFPNIAEDPKGLIADAATVGLFKEIQKKYNPEFNHVEQIKKFTLLPEEWTVDSGILTPKLSIRRKEVLKRFADVIDKMYE